MLMIWLLLLCAVYAIVMFSVQGLLRWRKQKKYDRILSSAENKGPEEVVNKQASLPELSAEETEKRLNQLKEHLDSGLITKGEYKAKRQEILKEL